MRILIDSINRRPDIIVRMKKEKMIGLSIMVILKKTSTLKLIHVHNIFNISSLLNIHYILYHIILTSLLHKKGDV